MKQYLIGLFALLLVALAGDIFLARQYAQLQEALGAAQSRLAVLEEAQERTLAAQTAAQANAKTTESPSAESTPAADSVRLSEPFERFVVEQRKAYAYLMAKVDYLLDTSKMLEDLALLADAPPQERQRLQLDLEDALNKRAHSKEEFEEAARKYQSTARRLVADERNSAGERKRPKAESESEPAADE